jgi:CRP/FNR family cyclic AMP-dependent transcriptional regulator
VRTLPLTGGMLETVVRALGRSQLFVQLDDSQLEKVARASELQQSAAQEVLLHEGGPSVDFFVLLSGEVRIEKGGKVLGHLSAVQTLGEIGVLLDSPRTASVTADVPCLLLRFDADILDQMFRKVPGFGLALSRALGERVVEANRRASYDREEDLLLAALTPS